MVVKTRSKRGKNMEFIVSVDPGDLFKNMTSLVSQKARRIVNVALKKSIEIANFFTAEYILENFQTPKGKRGTETIPHLLIAGLKVKEKGKMRMDITSNAITSNGEDLAPHIHFGTKKNYLAGGVIINNKRNSSAFSSLKNKQGGLLSRTAFHKKVTGSGGVPSIEVGGAIQKEPAGGVGLSLGDGDFMLPQFKHPGWKRLRYMDEFQERLQRLGGAIISIFLLGGFGKYANLPGELSSQAKSQYKDFGKLLKPYVLPVPISGPNSIPTYAKDPLTDVLIRAAQESVAYAKRLRGNKGHSRAQTSLQKRQSDPQIQRFIDKYKGQKGKFSRGV